MTPQCPLCDTPCDTPPMIPKREATTSVSHSCSQMQHHSHDDIYWCTTCHTGFLWPMPTPAALNQQYSSAEDPLYLQEKAARYHTFEHALKILLPFATQGRLLEIGSYCGLFLKCANDAGFEAQGVEPSAWACQVATSHFQQTVQQGSFEDPIIQESLKTQKPFDVVVAWDVLEHVSKPLEFLSQVEGLLSPGGIFAFSTLDIDNWLPRLLGKHWPWYMQPHLYYFTQKGLRKQLAEHGFEWKHHEAYRHVISVRYLFYKLQSLLPLGNQAPKSYALNALGTQWFVPFQFGDIVLVVAQKTAGST